MTAENIKTASTVLSEFLIEQTKDNELNQGTVSTIVKLREEGSFTRTNLLRQLEEARKVKTREDVPKEVD